MAALEKITFFNVSTRNTKTVKKCPCVNNRNARAAPLTTF